MLLQLCSGHTHNNCSAFPILEYIVGQSTFGEEKKKSGLVNADGCNRLINLTSISCLTTQQLDIYF